MAAKAHHLYVHVPFCRLVCAYCDFITVGGRGHDMPRYAEALQAELALRPGPGTLRTIYFGGGTPSLLDARLIGAIVDAASGRWDRVALDEVSLEANPSARETPDWVGLRAAGVTRVSLGVQSLRDSELRTLARGHTAAEARAAFAAARAAGLENISVDLIYGIPGQSLDDWCDGLQAAIELEPEHLSCYALQLVLAPDEWAAPPRRGALRWRGRMAAAQDDDLAAAQYALAEERLDAAGYRHYELSSWARPGCESRHNAGYWERHPYTGLGAGAHSYDGRSERSWNTRDLDEYLRAIEAGVPATAGNEQLDEAARAFEGIALGLRRVDGLSRHAFAAEFGSDPIVRYAQAVAETTRIGLLEVEGDALRLSETGRLLASEALVSFAD